MNTQKCNLVLPNAQTMYTFRGETRVKRGADCQQLQNKIIGNDQSKSSEIKQMIMQVTKQPGS